MRNKFIYKNDNVDRNELIDQLKKIIVHLEDDTLSDASDTYNVSLDIVVNTEVIYFYDKMLFEHDGRYYVAFVNEENQLTCEFIEDSFLSSKQREIKETFGEVHPPFLGRLCVYSLFLKKKFIIHPCGYREMRIHEVAPFTNLKKKDEEYK